LTSPQGLSIIGATVFIDGTTEGALTDIDGKFQFEASVALPFDLVIHFMGYEEIKMPIESFGRKLKIQLKSSDVMLKAVEVVDRRITEKQQMARLDCREYGCCCDKGSSIREFL
jgi:hypothetical protein